ncbi:hypothetical protein FLBR109950_03825 [Flavobacterium branchiophilum]|uniref:Uncharacterized protein n=1 Tax=Flavobacterium branchiophilum (strain FL-15) TaxID=1034807 RepID=G2Z418_FLABF|nr:hypothetical protein [Flavobacterium branchiophilum]CCB68355.1 Hypothetical protein FBFL15_0208 [Flavobacterium branchiophilum FL-15]
MTEYDKELFEKLKDLVDNKIIKIHESNEFVFKILESNYPMGFSGIEWNENYYIENLINTKIDSIFNILSNNKLKNNEKVYVFGDGLTDFCYEMKFETFKDYSFLFLEIPQNFFLYFKDTQKCLNITFANEIFFG